MAASEDLDAAAAELLARGGSPEPIGAADVRRFLGAIGYGEAAGSTAEGEARTRLLRAAAGFDAVFRLRSRTAPGLVFFGGMAAPPDAGGPAASLNGAGETAGQAFEACVGEGVEYLSQFRRPGDAARTGTIEAVAPWSDSRLARRLRERLDVGGTAAPDAIEWVRATRLSDGEPGWLPAALVLREAGRDPADERRLAPGCGCAAGSTWDAALAAALFEVVERDAVALWWQGGRPGRPIGLETLAETGAAATVQRIRQGSGDRATSLVDISGDLGIPCIAALSFDRAGRGFAAGFGCRSDAKRACAAALVEMCQMELGREIAAARNSRPGGVGDRDADVSPSEPGLMDGLLGPVSLGEAASRNGPHDLSPALARLAAHGFEAYAADLTRPEFGIPVARVVVPGLQPYPSSFASPRLAEAMAGAPARTPAARGIDLF